MPRIKEKYYRSLLDQNWEETAVEIGRFISDQVAGRRAGGIVVGISGGLDSAAVSFLGARALGARRVKGLFLPERDTAAESYEHARKVAKEAGFLLEEIDLTPALDSLGCYRGAVAGLTRIKAVNQLAFWGMRRFFQVDPYLALLEGTDSSVLNQAIAFFRFKHRLRMAVLYRRAEQESMLVAGCLNLTEHLTGFFVPYGDSAADLAPILSLYKSQVRRLASHLGVPESIIKKPPSPDLLPGIVDEMALGISYEKLDLILHALGEGRPHADIADCVAVSSATVKRVKQLVELSERLRTAIPYPELWR